MIRTAALLLLLALPLRAETVAEQAARASADLQRAVAALEEATESRDRVKALSQTIRAYESGLAALRGALRQAALRESALTRALDAKRDGSVAFLACLPRWRPIPAHSFFFTPKAQWARRDPA
jgi:murein hydrolase activator